MTSPEIRKLAEVITTDAKGSFRKVSVGEPCKTFLGPEKVLMLLGEKGTVKSTLINGLVNYIMGVKYENKFRYKLVDDKTKEITAYTFRKQRGFRLPYTFTIIDTPGYGDTEGLKRDKEITKQIKEFFSHEGPEGINHLNGIGFVVKASDGRLTPTQKYIFDSILSMFGKDFSQNIFMMVTFADGSDPLVLDALKDAKFTFQQSFKFNNSALFAKIDEKNVFNSMFWKMGVGSFDDFFSTFDKAMDVSLTLTRQVLHEREHLECVLQGLQQNIQAGLFKADQLHQEERIIKEHEKDLLRNKDFTYEINVTKQRRVDLPRGTYATNCLQCHVTCHYPCYIPKNEELVGCAAMSNCYCTVCPGKCFWRSHVNNGYKLQDYMEKETRTSKELKRPHDEAARNKTATEQVLEGLKKDLDKLYLTVFGMVRQANRSIHRLNEIALRPNSLSEIQHIELLIDTEKREGKPEFQQRIRALEDVLERAKIIAGIKDESKIQQMLKESAQYCRTKLKF